MRPSTPTGASAGTEQVVEADTLCVGYGFFPSVELLRLAAATSPTTRASAGRWPCWTSGFARPCRGLGGRRRHGGCRSRSPRSTGVASLRSARRSTSGRWREPRRTPRAPLRARLASQGGVPARPQPLHAVGAGIYELADGRHGRLPLRRSDGGRAGTRRSRHRPTSTSSRASREPGWASARDGTASARSPRWSPRRHGVRARRRAAGDAPPAGASRADRRRWPTRRIEDGGFFTP